MKATILLAALATLSAPASAFAGDLLATDAKNHIGETVTVRGTVQEIKASPKAVFLDIDGIYPGEPFMIVCFDTTLAPQLRPLQHTQIAVTGRIVLYKGTPEIILSSMHQISK